MLKHKKQTLPSREGNEFFKYIMKAWRKRCETLELNVPGSKDHRKRFPEKYHSSFRRVKGV